MKHLSELMPANLQGRLEAAREGSKLLNAAAIADGVEKFGWSPDALCAACGDTGQIPRTNVTCTCAAGRRRQITDRQSRARREFEKRWEEAGVPRRFARCRLERALDPAAAEEARAWIERLADEAGENLILSGPTGTGKTGLAIGILWEIHERALLARFRFVGCSAFLDALRPGGDSGLLAACQDADCLVFDDLGTARGTEWEMERIYALFNARYEAERPTIVTTNASIAELSQSIGARVVSRLVEVAKLVVMDGPDRRLERSEA
jgi:DNA replication protein DnaC